MSGLTPKYSDAPPQHSFAPVFTSSKFNNARVGAKLAQAFKKSGLRRTEPDVHHDRLKKTTAIRSDSARSELNTVQDR